MVAQGGFNRTAVLVHALAIVAGLLAGWFVMDRITPNYPTEDPGVESSSAPGSASDGDEAFDLATPDGPRWYVQFDVARTDAGPPFDYTAPLEGEPVRGADRLDG